MTSRREPSERFAKIDDNALFARRHAVVDRMSRTSGVGVEDVRQWARKTEYGTVHSGTMVPFKAGRAIGRVRDDGRIIEEIDQELSERGYSVEEISVAYHQHCAEVERAAIAEEATHLGDEAFFRILDGEVDIESPAPTSVPAVVPPPDSKAAPARRGRDRLAWVPVMRALAERYATWKPKP